MLEDAEKTHKKVTDFQSIFSMQYLRQRSPIATEIIPSLLSENIDIIDCFLSDFDEDTRTALEIEMAKLLNEKSNFYLAIPFYKEKLAFLNNSLKSKIT